MIKTEMNVFWKEIIAVALFGAIGSLSRFGLSSGVQYIFHRESYPWGIFTCNVLGCLLVGMLYGFLVHRGMLSPFWRAGILIGFLGGFTTFSSFTLDTLSLFLEGEIFESVMNVCLTVFMCLLFTFIGFRLIR